MENGRLVYLVFYKVGEFDKCSMFLDLESVKYFVDSIRDQCEYHIFTDYMKEFVYG